MYLKVPLKNPFPGPLGQANSIAYKVLATYDVDYDTQLHP